MKRFVSFILVILMITALVGCGVEKIDPTIPAIAECLGLEIEEPVFFEMIEAIDGKQYENGKIEIYQFDKNDAAYEKVITTGYEMTFGDYVISFKATAYNDGFVLYLNDEVENPNDIIEAFENIRFN